MYFVRRLRSNNQIFHNTLRFLELKIVNCHINGRFVSLFNQEVSLINYKKLIFFNKIQTFNVRSFGPFVYEMSCYNKHNDCQNGTMTRFHNI